MDSLQIRCNNFLTAKREDGQSLSTLVAMMETQNTGRSHHKTATGIERPTIGRKIG